MATEKKKILVVGGGIAGMTAALEAAEVGREVILCERRPYLGGRVAQLYRYFPKLCPPACGLEINYKRIKANPRLQVLTLTEVVSVSGSEGAFKVTLRSSPRYVNEKCTCCGKCAEACALEVPDLFNYGMSTVKAAHLPHANAFPARYVLEPELVAKRELAEKVKAACEPGAIDLEESGKSFELEVGAIVWATGWDPYDPTGVQYYGFGKHPDVITNVMMERLAALDGPTGGKILRRSDGAAPQHVVFVQCAGSRDEHHLAHCSGVCCLASLKQATYVREQLPESKVTICYIDIRTPDRLEDFYLKVQQDPAVAFVKSKIADISAKGDKLLLHGEDTLAGKRVQLEADLVVLATGIVPCRPDESLKVDENGFLTRDQVAGYGVAGCAVAPVEVSSTVQDGTAAALRAIQSLAR